MDITLNEYINKVKENLTINNSIDTPYYTFNYSENIIDDNIDYFKCCLKENLSPYKALLLFNK